VAEEYATALRDTIFARPDWASNYVATMNDSKSRWYFQRIDDLAVCYEQFGDPWFYEKSVELARLAIDLDDSSGIVREVATGRERKSGSKHPSYIFYKAPNLLSYMRNLEGEEFQRAKNALVKLAEHQFRTQSVETRTIGPRMAAAYYFTKDGRYLDYGVQRLDEFRRWTLRGERTPAGYTTIPHRATAKDALIDAAHLMGALAESPGPAPGARAARLMKHLSWPAIEFVFVKEQGRALEIELSASAATFTSPAPPQGGGGNPWPASWLGEPIRYYAHHDAMGFFNSDLPLEYRRASIPAEAPAGEYRISVGREGEAYVFAANATRAVMVAPEGFCVGGGMLVAGARIAWGSGHDDRWYFQVPQDAGGFRIAGTAVERLVIRDPDGKTVALEATGGGVHRIAVPPVAAGRLWSIEAAGAADVVFSGIRPVFACRDAKTFFMPAETAVVNKEKLVPPATYAPQQQARPRGTRAESAPESPGRKPPRDAAKQRAKGPGSIEAPRPKRRPRPAGNSGPAPGSPAGAPPEPPRLQPRDQAGSATPPARDPSADGDAALRPGRRQAPASSPRKAEQFRVWNEEPEKLKTPAFAIADDLYQVGNSHFSSHLLVGKKELVLIDTPMAAQFDLLVQSIRSVGVDPAKITLIIHTHAHYDHYGATARMVKLSGARTAIGAKEIEGPLQQPHILEPGARGFYSRQGWSYEPFNIHMLLEHGQTIDIGGTVIHCHHTPGHTKGTMSYTFDVVMDGQRHTALLWGGPGLHMFKPNQTDDWTRTFAYLKTLKGDVPLGAHPFMNDTMGKYAKRQQGVKPDPFIDPDGWKKFLEKQEAEFQEILAKVSQQQKGNSK
jgi:metallo-beta-lactamase class B